MYQCGSLYIIRQCRLASKISTRTSGLAIRATVSLRSAGEQNSSLLPIRNRKGCSRLSSGLSCRKQKTQRLAGKESFGSKT